MMTLPRQWCAAAAIWDFNLMDIITSLLSSYLFAAIIFLMKNTGAGKEFIEYGNEDIIFFIKCVLFFAAA